MNADTYSDSSNFSIGDDEQLYLAAFYSDHVVFIIPTPFPDVNVPKHDPIPTCPTIVPAASGIKESITTITPLSHSRSLHKKTRSSDLRADFLHDEIPVVKLPVVPSSRIQTVKSLVQTRGSHHGSPSRIQARVVYQLMKFSGATAKIFRRRHGPGFH